MFPVRAVDELLTASGSPFLPASLTNGKAFPEPYLRVAACTARSSCPALLAPTCPPACTGEYLCTTNGANYSRGIQYKRGGKGHIPQKAPWRSAKGLFRTRDGTRTRTSVKTRDFKSLVATITPLWLVTEAYSMPQCNKVTAKSANAEGGPFFCAQVALGHHTIFGCCAKVSRSKPCYKAKDPAV